MQIVLHLPQEKVEKVAEQLNQKFPTYAISHDSPNNGSQLGLNELLSQFNRSLKGKVIFSHIGLMLNLLTEFQMKVDPTILLEFKKFATEGKKS